MIAYYDKLIFEAISRPISLTKLINNRDSVYKTIIKIPRFLDWLKTANGNRPNSTVC